MRLEVASKKAIFYACMNFHYAKVLPATSFGFSVFNDLNEWCGVITFGNGAGANMGRPFGLMNGQYLELTRMALNGKQESTSKAMSIAIKLIKRDYPNIKLLISYADKGQYHVGTIYQACNWVYIGDSKSSGIIYFVNGKWRHNRTLNEYPKDVLEKLQKVKKPGKYKYIYPLDNSMQCICKELSKPYPKKAEVAQG